MWLIIDCLISWAVWVCYLHCLKNFSTFKLSNFVKS